MERGIEFLLSHQAGFEARLTKTEAQITQTSQQVEGMAKQVETLAQIQAEFAQYVRRNLEAQSELNQSLRETVRALTMAQARTDERLGDLESGDEQG